MTARFQSKDKSHTLEGYQFPIVNAWAMTIHKVQGLSMDRAVIDLGDTCFSHGGAYVALSRVRSLNGVLLTGLVKKSLEKKDALVQEEYARLAALPISL